MDQVKKCLKSLADEWELLALTVVTLALAFTLAGWLFGGRKETGGGSAPRSLPIPESRINIESAYAMLMRKENSPEPPDPMPFTDASTSTATGTPAETPSKSSNRPPKKTPKTEQPTTPTPQPEETPPPDEADVDETPTEEPDQTPAEVRWHVFTYKGYRTTATGTRLAMFENHTTGERVELEEGHQLRGFMIAEFTGNQVVFLTPGGKERAVPANREIRLPAR
ncbi:MAG: hypothetical protein K9N51_04860 [Candidatus Pacebacteria bacterium]|nr:hypothetical protein [Candidatus Paceibacterota bacterium]